MKRALIIAGLILTTTYGVLSWDLITHSAPPGPEDSVHAEYCSARRDSDGGLDETRYDLCCIQYNEAFDAAERDWDNTLQALLDQEKPASAMVEEGYESLRTFNCWLEYICRAVEYSGRAPIETEELGLMSKQIGRVPGCQKPEHLKMGTEYDKFIKDASDVPVLGILFRPKESKINYIPGCMTSPKDNNEKVDINLVNRQFNSCKRDLALKFGCPPDVPQEFCNDFSNSFVKLETVLKKTSADQKASALEKKLGQIIPKMHGMESHVGYLSNFLEQLNVRFACYAGKCT